MARRKPKRYHIGDAEGMITASQLRRADRETQKEVISDWFHGHFQDPVDCCPYDSGEGGYQYIRGGPYDPHDVLSEEFEDIVRPDFIQEVADELWGQSAEWEGRDRGEDEMDVNDFGSYFFESLARSTGHLKEFDRSIQDIKSALHSAKDDPNTQFLLRLLYANVVTALEAYLSDFFSSAVTEHKELRRKFVETNPDFRNEKMSVSDIYKAWEKLEAKLNEYLADIAWHNLARIKPMFKSTLGITFPKDLDNLFKGILIRHDLVHRNGKKKGGGEHVLKPADIEALIGQAESLVNDIDTQWQNVKPGSGINPPAALDVAAPIDETGNSPK